MAETTTPNFGWTKPDLGGDASTWGNVLNTTIDAVDAVTWANQQASVPIGSLTMWAGPTGSPPANWLICDGRTLDYGATPAYQGLFNIIGRAFNTSLTGTQFALPNLVQKFPLGAGSNPVGQSSGSFSVPIATGNLPPHAHLIYDIAHNHSVNQWTHNHADAGHWHDPTASYQDPHAHNVPGSAGGGFGAAQPPQPVVAGQGVTATDARQPQLHISIGTGYASLDSRTSAISLNASGTGLSTTQNTGSGTPLSVVQPFLAINFIIRYK